MRRRWRDEARTAIAELKNVAHGSREAEMQTIARQISGHTDTTALRRAIAANQFLEQLGQSDPQFYGHLEDAPLSIVEIFARWHAFDPAGAAKVAAGWAGGSGNVATLTKAMHEARPEGYAGKSGTTLEKAFLAASKPIIAAAVHELTNIEPKMKGSSIRDQATGQTLDFVFEVDGKSLAVLVVGPYSNPKLYANRCVDWVAKAHYLALLFDRILLALPNATALEEYQRRIGAVRRALSEHQAKNKLGRNLPAVDVVYIDVPKMAPQDEDAIALFGNHTSASEK